ncbi:MAG: hypothetical protein WC341_15850 [Bacteroidales bacterium]
MKKLFFLSVVFLLGMSRLSAQNAWEVKVDWQVAGSSTCDDVMFNYGYLVAITIVDEANNNAVVTYNAYNVLPSGTYSTTFNSSQVGVEDYCAEQHDAAPSFKIFVAVQMRDASGEIFCETKGTFSPYTCSLFGTYGVEISGLLIE